LMFFILVNAGISEKKSYFCSFTAVPPTIDGFLDEWRNVPAIFLPTTDEERVKVSWSGPSDLSCYFKMMWDDKNLYLGVEVLDNIFKQTHDDLSLSGIWSEDSIQVGFDMGADAKISGYDYNDYEYGFALTKGGPRAFRWYSSNLVSGRCDNLLEMAVKRDEELKKIIYEIAIPWKELQFSPQASKEFGFTIVIQDSDDGDYGYIQWTPGITLSKDPTAFGRVYLVKDIPVESNKIKLSLSCKDSYTEKEAEIGLIINSSDELKNCKINVDILKDEQINLSQIKDIDIKKGIQQVFLKLPIEGFSMGEYNLKVSLIDSQNILLGKSVAKFKKISIDGIRQELIEFSNVEYPKLSQEINELENSGKDATYQKISLSTLVLFTKFINSNLDEEDWIPLACEEIVGYKKILNRVKEELDRIKKGEKVSFSSSIVYDASKPVIIKNSEFYQGNNPIMFIGVVHPRDMGGISVLPDYGFNSVTIEMGPWSFLETPEGYKNDMWPWPTQAAVDSVKEKCKTCQEKNIG
ncbi:MAG TPA: sugar-binding protein, partial [Candidatus Ratteibacteria bacterium]|nr:sugar-binding protein [Candidatus Ratteibacteria bacterium]